MTVSPTAQLDRLEHELDACDARAAALAASCTRAQWQARPPGGGWSASECVQHLVLSVDATLPRIDAALHEGQARQLRAPGPYRAGLVGRLLIWSLEPPYRLRSKTGAAFVPASCREPGEDVDALREAHDRVRRSLRGAGGLALDRLTIRSPFVERATYNVYAAFAILAVHARRHLWQAEQALRRTISA